MNNKEFFPDGTPVDEWFYDTSVPTLDELGRQYVLTQYGILDDGKIYTKEIQRLIDTAAAEGGGVIVVPAGTYLTGSLWFKQGVNLYVAEGGTLKGSDDISDYPLCETRMEGENCVYFPALINADGVDGFTMCGKGVIDGNGLRAWKSFWLRRKWNPECTNKDEQRPRLVFLSNCRNATVAQLHLQNSHFWTNHIYKCSRVRFLDCTIFSPAEPVKAPSTDAIDIDVCSDVLVKGCYMEVNDDAVALKGGRGPWADTDPGNGTNERILIEDCEYGFCHSCFTCGSESVHNRNVIVRRISVRKALCLFKLKMRPDTPQHYEYIEVDGIDGQDIHTFIEIKPWTQFFDLKDRKDIPLSYADNITIKNCKCNCNEYFAVDKAKEQYVLSDFILENLDITARYDGFSYDKVENVKTNNIKLSILDS